MSDFLHYNAFAELIEHQGWWFHPSEAHGILSGLICADHENQRNTLLFPEGETELGEQTLEALSTHIQSKLAGRELRFQLLLPEDKDLSARAEALGFWAQGFHLAVQYLREKTLFTPSDDARDALEDLEAMSQLDPDIKDNEKNRRLLNTLEEHARMVALLIYADTRQAKPQNTAS
ncbi:UPF0149 family protein [Suttonella sp. R2A3]|uniref:UPF0149 family protein n=1 Tax=Suttonella sp. R2A3 TaxID=2908648 RepID=UPI001F3047EF|nr:UPF0149 family protein [Suttonella sp. R2A3]UJF25201.1 UPF0149 family protein [Suttonella sp. R2A3]